MQKVTFLFFIFLLLLRAFFAVAQPIASVDETLKKEQVKFAGEIRNISSDSVIIYPLARYFELQVPGIQASIKSEAALPVVEKEKAIRSLVYFINELSKNVAQQKSDMYDIPGALQSYKTILMALMHHKPFVHLLTPLSARRSQLLAVAFSQYKEYPLLDDIAVYKRVVSSPEFILQFLESKPDFRFADSLLIHAAVHDPIKFTHYLNTDKPGIQSKIRNTKNKYLQELVYLSKDKNTSELLPFITQMADNGITAEEILEKRKDVTSCFQLLTNTLKESRSSSSAFLKLLRRGIKEKALSFYVNHINELHNAEDAVRFASVKGLRPEDIYYIITSCGEELYTSSYLGLYKRLMQHFKNQSADSLFDIAQYDNFYLFMRIAANYNTLTDFLSNMPVNRAAELLKRFIAGIESDPNSGLEKAMDIADSFTGLGSATEISGMIQNELQSNLKRCQSQQLYLGIRLYGILLQVFDLVKQNNSVSKLWATIGNYEMLKRNVLENSKGEVVELVLFYGDEDGVASFNNFQKLFADNNKWEISKKENWISIRSLTDQPVLIYANMPLDEKQELDIKAQDALINFLQQESLEPAILIHRGHSYHLDKTLKRLKPSVKLALLGSCGGYNGAISIASINQDAQIIVSKKTGSKLINDPIIDVINETLLNKKDLSWVEIWENLSSRFSKDETTLNLFNEYIPPSKNISLLVLKLFNFYNRFA